MLRALFIFAALLEPLLGDLLFEVLNLPLKRSDAVLYVIRLSRDLAEKLGGLESSPLRVLLVDPIFLI
jgi:hypothetical protein